MKMKDEIISDIFLYGSVWAHLCTGTAAIEKPLSLSLFMRRGGVLCEAVLKGDVVGILIAIYIERTLRCAFSPLRLQNGCYGNTLSTWDNNIYQHFQIHQTATNIASTTLNNLQSISSLKEGRVG